MHSKGIIQIELATTIKNIVDLSTNRYWELMLAKMREMKEAREIRGCS